MHALLRHLPRPSASDRFADGLRVLLALAGIIAYGDLAAQPHRMIPMLLGAIACALAETEEAWKGRLVALAVTLACFTAAAFAVETLFEQPVAFAVVLALGSFALVMLGAASPRYATIANATLLLAVYTMIGRDQPAAVGAPLWREPLLLVAGAGWYGVFSLAWSAWFVQHPVRQAQARLYETLADYLDAKARLFVPERRLDADALRLDLARHNARVVDALNETRRMLIDRLHGRRSRAAMAAALHRYLVAQDVHERASSSHYPYRELAEAFFHSDVLFRCQRQLQCHARRCRELAAAQRYDRPATTEDLAAADASAALEDARAYLRARGEDGPHEATLRALARNLDSLRHLLDGDRKASTDPAGAPLQDPSPESLLEAWRRIRVQLTPASARFRHGLRLGLAMLAGYLVLRLLHPQQGYWILLTTMLVCQAGYEATWRRLAERVAGTVAGLVAGWALLRLFPDASIQLALTVASGVLFFVARHRRYVLATAAVTVLVLLAFNQVGSGYGLIWPRLLDTLIGGALAAGATALVLPEARERETRLLLAAALRADAGYLRQIMRQYRHGKRDDLEYRIARRDAHNADAAVSAHLAATLREPAQRRDAAERALRLLVRTHALLGHLSALGAHRRALADAGGHTALTQTASRLAAAIEDIASTLEHRPRTDAPVAARPAATFTGTTDESQRIVATQLALIERELPVLREVAGHAAARPHRTGPAES